MIMIANASRNGNVCVAATMIVDIIKTAVTIANTLSLLIKSRIILRIAEINTAMNREYAQRL